MLIPDWTKTFSNGLLRRHLDLEGEGRTLGEKIPVVTAHYTEETRRRVLDENYQSIYYTTLSFALRTSSCTCTYACTCTVHPMVHAAFALLPAGSFRFLIALIDPATQSNSVPSNQSA